MRCRHRNTTGAIIVNMNDTGDWRDWFAKECAARFCQDCREWLSLGPSNDDDPGVQVELRAAHLAMMTTDVAEFADSEWLGWNQDERYIMCGEMRTVWDDMSDERFAGWQAGWFAAEIHMHDDQTAIARARAAEEGE